MTIKNEKTQALKAADPKRIAACVKACEGISTENLINNVPLKQGLSGLNKRIREAEAQRDELLAEREADKVLIAQLRESNRILAADGIVKQDRITELEARTLTVKLPPVMRINEPGLSFNAYGQSGVQNALYEACAAAGITLVVEE